MTPSWVRRLGPALLFLGLAGAGYAQQPRREPPPPLPWAGPPTAWWRDAQFQKELQLSADQSKRIDTVFQTALPHLRHQRDELGAQETELSRLVESDASEAVIGKQSDRVEAVRASLNSERTLMLVHIRLILTPDQRLRMKTLRAQWDLDHPPPPRPGSASTSRPNNR